MKKLIQIIIVFLTISMTLFGQTPKDSINLKQEAENFSLSIVRLYFSEDCQEVFNLMNDSLLLMDGDGIFSKIKSEKKLCKSIKQAIRNKEKTFQDYKNSYKTEILTKAELEKKFNHSLPEYFELTEFDFFFIGFELKEGKEYIDDFIWDDLFLFMVRKEKNTWLLKGLSG